MYLFKIQYDNVMDGQTGRTAKTVSHSASCACRRTIKIKLHDDINPSGVYGFQIPVIMPSVDVYTLLHALLVSVCFSVKVRGIEAVQDTKYNNTIHSFNGHFTEQPR